MTLASDAYAPRHGFATLALLVFVALASDVGGLLGLWDGPLFFLHRDVGIHEAFVTLQKVDQFWRLKPIA